MEISRDGHRARMRAAYLQGGGDAMPDHQLLELLLSISIPRKDVKPIAYALINRFGSLEQVFAAGAADLQQVPGVGEQTAVQILLLCWHTTIPAARPNPLRRIWNSLFVCFPFCVPFMCSCWIILSSVLPTPTPCAATQSTVASSPSNNAMYKRNRSLVL